MVLVEELGKKEDGGPGWSGELAVDEEFLWVDVTKEEGEEPRFLFDLDEREAVFLLLVLARREGEDVVEDGGGRSKMESSSCEEDSVARLNDEVGPS